jgi:hypothetical protein
LPFNVAKLPHTLAECLKTNREYSGLGEKAYLSDFCWLLRFDWMKKKESQPKRYHNNYTLTHGTSVQKSANPKLKTT